MMMQRKAFATTFTVPLSYSQLTIFDYSSKELPHRHKGPTSNYFNEFLNGGSPGLNGVLQYVQPILDGHRTV